MAEHLSARKSLSSILICFIVLFCFNSPLNAATPPGERYGGSIILSSTSDPKSFNDIIGKETTTSMVTALIFDGLTSLNAQTLKVEPALADHWEVSADGLTWTFYLKHDLQWNDGVDFTADDVVFTFNELIFNDNIPSSSRDIFSIDGKNFKVEKVDDLTVRFTLPVKFAPFLRSMSQAILPQHKLAQAVKDGKFNFTWGIDTPPQEIVGTGAFRLVQYRPGERLVFERNPYYWKHSAEGDQLPYLDRLIFMIVQNRDTEIMKFLDGELDYTDVRGSDYPLLKPLEKERNFTIYNTGPDFGTNFIVLNQNPRSNSKTGQPFVDPIKLKWFTDVHFRQAIAHAIDKKKMIEILKNGLGYEQLAAMSPSAGFFYNPQVPVYDYDLAKAKQILKDAGYVDRNGDGIIEDAQGHKVEFNLISNSDNVERMQMAAIICSDLQKLGIKVNLVGWEFNILVGKLNSTFDWDAILLGLTGGVEPHFGKNVWHSSGQLHMWNPAQEHPMTEWEKRIDELFSLGVQELDDNKRKVIYDEFQAVVAEQLPLIYTVLSANIYVMRNKFGNLKPTSYGGILHNIEEIYLKKESR